MTMVVALSLPLAVGTGLAPARVYAGPPDAMVDTLSAAHRDLERNTALEARTAAGLEELKQTGRAPADVITDYEAYLEHVRAMVAENRRLVQQLETLRLEGVQPASSTQALQAGQMIDAPIPETTVTDEVAALDRELNASLAEFDELLLEEMERIRERSSPRVDALAQAAADAAERLKEKGIDIEASGSQTESESSPSGQREASAAMPGKTSSPTAANAPGRASDSGKTATPGGGDAEGIEGDRQTPTGRRDGGDDDIVARQLREAAEQETDPVLKEKLWKEYDTYKRGGM
jgi:hypothetical protein